ncbi:MAG: PilX N-terminal domain-containing pilus assembly protein [Gammaproteobacteria bacterium]|nr:PilX N-terminal domain-containing pilus assembly protein [Gammaproteobacteria bacterium]
MKMQKQRGIALVIGLVMLMILTIMGVSSMSNTTLQLKIARNTQEQNIAFQTALAGIDFAISNADLTNQDTPQAFNYVMPVSALTASGTTTYLGCTRVFGGSIDRAGSQNVFQTISTGLSPSGSRSVIVSAVGKPTPAACQN